MVSVKESKQQVLDILGHCNVAQIKSELGIKGDARKAEFWNQVLVVLQAKPSKILPLPIAGDSVGNYLLLDTSRSMAAKVLYHHSYRGEIPLDQIKVDRVTVKDQVISIEATLFVGSPVGICLTDKDYYFAAREIKEIEELEDEELYKRVIASECEEKNLAYSWKKDPNFKATFFDSRDRNLGKISKQEIGWQIQPYHSYQLFTTLSLIDAVEMLFALYQKELEFEEKLSNYALQKFNYATN